MKILILGGTAFLGRHLVNTLLHRGHELCLFNRGLTDPDFSLQHPNVECIKGDRDGEDLSQLADRQWDAVIDTSAYLPRVIQQSLQALFGNVSHYVFISSISVYSDFSVLGITEDAPRILLDDPLTEKVGLFYGGLKALCEDAVKNAYAEHSLIVRPGLIVGPFDPTDRFSYWPDRIARGGAVLVPGSPDAPFQAIDARDLAEWIVMSVENSLSGIYNVTGPLQPMNMGELFETCQNVLNDSAELIWPGNDFLLANDVGAWIEMPFWIGDMDMPGLLQCDCRKAINAGLKCRPMASTIADTYSWSASRGNDYEWKAGLSATREQELLDRNKAYVLRKTELKIRPV